MAELHRAGDTELREAVQVGGIDALRVLDPLPKAERLPDVTGRLERVERLAVRAVADRVHADGPASAAAARISSASSSPLVMHTPLPSSIHAVCEPSVPSMNVFR